MVRAGMLSLALILSATTTAAPFAPGTRFGTIGVDYRFSSGDLYTYSYDEQFVKVDPFFRVGISVLPQLAVGAELALFNTFPNGGDIFTSTPIFAFGPAATYYLLPNTDIVQPYVAAGGGATYAFVWDRLGWRTRLASGVAVVSRQSFAFALEGGWYHDWGQQRRRNSRTHEYEMVWLHGSSWFVGVRVMGFK